MLDWVQAHWADIMATISAVLLLGHAVVKLTPTDKDDLLVAKIESVLKGIIGEKTPPSA
jgi:hypothetical protein